MAGLRTPSSAVRAVFGRLDADEVALRMDLEFRMLPGYARFVDEDPVQRGHPAIRWNVARLAGTTTGRHIEFAGRLRSQRLLAPTEGGQIVGLSTEDFDWDPLLDDPRLLLACERPNERARLAATLESLRMVVRFADDAGRTGLVTVRDFLPHLLLAQSPEIADNIVTRVFGDLADRAVAPRLAGARNVEGSARYSHVLMDTFEGRGAVITGGAGGIGLASACEFARRGARVVLADVDHTALDAAVARLRADGFDAHGVGCDVRHLDQLLHLADEAFRLLGRVDVVFSNAGIVVGGAIARMTHDDWRFVIDVDLWGSIHTVEAFVPRLLDQGTGGHVAFTASFAGLVPNAGLGAYGVAKYGVVGLAETLAREVKDHGIGVSVLCPMVVETNLVANSERVRGDARGPKEVAMGSFGTLPEHDHSLGVDDVARLTADAILANRLYVLPHEASRTSIRRRFERIDRTFDDQAAEGWRH